MFFESYLSDALNDKHSIFPELTTISDFIDEYSDLVEAGRVEQLFLLYQAYRTLAERDQKQYDDFDHFLHLGDMLLNDFNDIDRYMVDAKELFFNMRNLENIKTDYLSDEQIAVIKEYWGVDKKEVKEDSLFVQSSYVNLWNNMYELYNSFRIGQSAESNEYNPFKIEIIRTHFVDFLSDAAVTLPSIRQSFFLKSL